MNEKLEKFLEVSGLTLEELKEALNEPKTKWQKGQTKPKVATKKRGRPKGVKNKKNENDGIFHPLGDNPQPLKRTFIDEDGKERILTVTKNLTKEDRKTKHIDYRNEGVLDRKVDQKVRSKIKSGKLPPPTSRNRTQFEYIQVKCSTCNNIFEVDPIRVAGISESFVCDKCLTKKARS